MELSILGVVTLVAGAALLWCPPVWSFYALIGSTVLGAAAALTLPGGPSILVPNLMLASFAARMLLADGEGPAFTVLSRSAAGALLLVLTLYGALSAVFLPRLLEGATQTMTVLRSPGGLSSIMLAPLRPSGNNITQTVYALGGLVCFAMTAGFFLHRRSLEPLVAGLLLVSAVNLSFALLDVVTYAGGADYLLDFVRTANYALLTGAEKFGLKRIAGSFPEASAFAGFSLVLFCACASLWLDGVRPRLSGVLAALLLAALALSTSATAYVGLGACLVYLLVRSIAPAFIGGPVRRSGFLAVAAFGAAFAGLAALILIPSAYSELGRFLDEMLLNKLDSHSGRERMQWNMNAYQVFVDTHWLGAGVGSARASSFVLVLLSNVGLPGLLLFAAFVAAVFWSPSPRTGDGLESGAIRAAKAGTFACLAEASTSGTVYDLGLMFYILTGAVVGAALRQPARKAVARAGTLRAAGVGP